MDQKPGYHHGDLRRALLTAAREMITSGGVAQLSLRKVAQAAHVSHAAPYHHFKDKEALLAAVAEEGFAELRTAVIERTGGVDSPSRALQEAAIAYVVFAVGHKELFRLMFGPQLADKSEHPSLEAAGAAAYQAIEDGLRRFGPPISQCDQRSRSLSIAAWAAIHGLAVLMIDNQFGQTKAANIEDIAREVTDVFWVGISNWVSGS